MVAVNFGHNLHVAVAMRPHIFTVMTAQYIYGQRNQLEMLQDQLSFIYI